LGTAALPPFLFLAVIYIVKAAESYSLDILSKLPLIRLEEVRTFSKTRWLVLFGMLWLLCLLDQGTKNWEWGSGKTKTKMKGLPLSLYNKGRYGGQRWEKRAQMCGPLIHLRKAAPSRLRYEVL